MQEAFYNIYISSHDFRLSLNIIRIAGSFAEQEKQVKDSVAFLQESGYIMLSSHGKTNP